MNIESIWIVVAADGSDEGPLVFTSREKMMSFFDYEPYENIEIDEEFLTEGILTIRVCDVEYIAYQVHAEDFDLP